jgi:hypothetical protein
LAPRCCSPRRRSKDAKTDRLRAFDGAAFRAPRAEPSLVVLASAPSRNNPVTGGVLLTGAASEMPARLDLRPRPAKAASGADGEGTRLPARWRGDLIVTDDRPREFLQLSDSRYVRVTSTDDGELAPVEEPVKPQRARSRSASTAGAFSSHVVADAPGCGLCTWSPRDGRWALCAERCRSPRYEFPMRLPCAPARCAGIPSMTASRRRVHPLERTR